MYQNLLDMESEGVVRSTRGRRSKEVVMTKRKIVALHDAEALTLPLADGSMLRVTAFQESPRIALTIHGPGGGDAGGVILRATRARLLASWLARFADAMESAHSETS
jgi:hypothetical protein